MQVLPSYSHLHTNCASMNAINFTRYEENNLICALKELTAWFGMKKKSGLGGDLSHPLGEKWNLTKFKHFKSKVKISSFWTKKSAVLFTYPYPSGWSLSEPQGNGTSHLVFQHDFQDVIQFSGGASRMRMPSKFSTPCYFGSSKLTSFCKSTNGRKSCLRWIFHLTPSMSD